LLHDLGYRLQALQKTLEGTSHPDRNAQFEYINATATAFLQRQQPVISVDTNYDPLGIMETGSGAAVVQRVWTGDAAAYLIREQYT
jgi:hypothetical protein